MEMPNDYVLYSLEKFIEGTDSSDPRQSLAIKWKAEFVELLKLDQTTFQDCSQQVLSAIEDGYNSLTEITAETGLDSIHISQTISNLLQRKIIIQSHICPIQKETVYKINH